MTDAVETVAPPLQAEESHGHSHLLLALVVIAAAQLMVVLDASIVNIAVPNIQKALHFTSASATWVVNGYTLAFGGLLLLGGRTGDLFGRRRMFMVGIGVFTLASLLGGFATTQEWLIGSRILQGAGAAIASPTALALIATTFPEGRPRNKAMAVYAAMSGAGAAVGLIAGGLLTEYLSWRWVLFVNIPIGLLVLFAAPRVLGESSRERGEIDYVGAIAGTVGLTALVFGITRTRTEGWSDTWTIAAFASAVVILTIFVIIEANRRHPIMPLRLFKDRNRSGTYLAMLLVGAGMFAMFFFQSYFLQLILGYKPVKAGVAFLPFTVGIVIGAGFASQFVRRFPPRALSGVGLLMAAGGTLLLAQVTPSATYWANIFPPMIITSIGMGLTFVPLTLTAVAGVRSDDTGIASALLNTVQQVGGSIGLAILATISTTAADHRLPHADLAYFGAVTKHNVGLIRTAADALTHGYTSAFLASALMMAAGALVIVIVVNAKKQQHEESEPTVVQVG